MAKLVCEKCSVEQEVPRVCCGPGVAGSDPAKLYCPAGEKHGSAPRPQHCGQLMKVKQQANNSKATSTIS